MDDGSDGREPRSFSKMSVTVAPGKQSVVALKKRTFLINESPIIRDEGEKRGWGDEGC